MTNTPPQPEPGLIAAAGRLIANGHKTERPDYSELLKALAALPPDAVICSAALLLKVADELESYANDGIDRGFDCRESLDYVKQLRTAAEGGRS